MQRDKLQYVGDLMELRLWIRSQFSKTILINEKGLIPERKITKLI